MTLDLAGPNAGEVLVDLEASGVCHTDYHFQLVNTKLPIVPIHEGAGTVVLSFLPNCGYCRFCASGRPSLCPLALDVRFEETLRTGE